MREAARRRSRGRSAREREHAAAPATTQCGASRAASASRLSGERSGLRAKVARSTAGARARLQHPLTHRRATEGSCSLDCRRGRMATGAGSQPRVASRLLLRSFGSPTPGAPPPAQRRSWGNRAAVNSRSAAHATMTWRKQARHASLSVARQRALLAATSPVPRLQWAMLQPRQSCSAVGLAGAATQQLQTRLSAAPCRDVFTAPFGCRLKVRGSSAGRRCCGAAQATGWMAAHSVRRNWLYLILAAALHSSREP